MYKKKIFLTKRHYVLIKYLTKILNFLDFMISKRLFICIHEIYIIINRIRRTSSYNNSILRQKNFIFSSSKWKISKRFCFRLQLMSRTFCFGIVSCTKQKLELFKNLIVSSHFFSLCFFFIIHMFSSVLHIFTNFLRCIYFYFYFLFLK